MGRSVGSSDPAAARRVGCGRVGRSGHPSRVGRRDRLREGRSVGTPGLIAARAGGSVGRITRTKAHANLHFPKHVSARIGHYLPSRDPTHEQLCQCSTRRASSAGRVPQRAAAATRVGRSGGPSRDRRLRRLRGGSVGRVPRPQNLLRRAARGGSVGRTCRVGNARFQKSESVGRYEFTFNFAPPNG